jgi:hypothetical protein
MMDINTLAKASNIPIRNLRRLQKLGVLQVKPSKYPEIEDIKEKYKANRPLNVLQCLYLIKHPETHHLLNTEYVNSILSKLGDVKNESAPWTIASQIDLTAKKNSEAIKIVSEWVSNLILINTAFDKGKMQSHHFIASRLLYNVPDHLLDLKASKINICMYHCRNKLPSFWQITDKGTRYFRPQLDI